MQNSIPSLAPVPPRSRVVAMPTSAAAAVLAIGVALTLTRHDASVWSLLLLAPWAEEMVFRVGMQDALRRSHIGPLASIVMTAAAFALAHGLSRSWSLAFWVFWPALALGVLYQRSGRLAPCVLWHAVLNAAWVITVSSGVPIAAVLKL